MIKSNQVLQIIWEIGEHGYKIFNLTVMFSSHATHLLKEGLHSPLTISSSVTVVNVLYQLELLEMTVLGNYYFGKKYTQSAIKCKCSFVFLIFSSIHYFEIQSMTLQLTVIFLVFVRLFLMLYQYQYSRDLRELNCRMSFGPQPTEPFKCKMQGIIRKLKEQCPFLSVQFRNVHVTILYGKKGKTSDTFGRSRRKGLTILTVTTSTESVLRQTFDNQMPLSHGCIVHFEKSDSLAKY